jgi:hypothetical protein
MLARKMRLLAAAIITKPLQGKQINVPRWCSSNKTKHRASELNKRKPYNENEKLLFLKTWILSVC